MWLPIQEGVKEARTLVDKLSSTNIYAKCHYSFVPRGVGEAAVNKARRSSGKREEKKNMSQTGTLTEKGVEVSTTQTGKREREPSLSSVEASVTSHKAKRSRTRNTTISATCTPKKCDGEKSKKPAPEESRRARHKPVLIKPTEGSSYAEVLKDLKCEVNPETLGGKIRSVRETRNGEVLVEVVPAADGRSKLSAAIRSVVGEDARVRELVPRTEVEVLDLDTTTDGEEFEAAIRRHFGEQLFGEMKVCLTKRAFRATLKAFVEINEEIATKLVHAGHLKVGWMSCRVRKKIEVIRCYRCLGFGHKAASCKGPDRTKGC
ncbi:uncharacterized protein LOC117180444 [Belonocnema kinseyi]|uniref:uncharacterized protein LOC117180444 n=1 Tax=Belonocnema kinseyi TaxID=2817044 RepID=UPI00143D619E|nr:uncharacterized protein LOC117180444 [Belonocnema kinseyi]